MKKEKSSISSSLLGSGERLKTDRVTDETLEKYKHFSDSTNGTLNANEMVESSFAGPDVLESYNGMNHFCKNAFAIPSAPALSRDAYDDHCSFFITLANNSDRNLCNNLLKVLRRNCKFTTDFTRKFQLIDAILKHTTKAASKFFADLCEGKQRLITNRV